MLGVVLHVISMCVLCEQLHEMHNVVPKFQAEFQGKVTFLDRLYSIKKNALNFDLKTAWWFGT